MKMVDDIDLHIHSKYSTDGEFAPDRLVEMCSEAGIRIMAVTDHNTVKAIDEAQRAAGEYDIRYIPAVELDCVYMDAELHIIGYCIDYRSADFEAAERNVSGQFRSYSAEILELTRQLGFHITEEELNAVSGTGYWKELWIGETFAEVLLDKPGYLDNEILRPYRPGGARGDNPYVNFYWDFYSQGKPCYAKITYPEIREILTLIKDNGGYAVLAHPGNNLRNRFGLFDGIAGLGVDGVEVFCSYHDKPTAEYFYREAKKYGLAVTCGSDFHGKTKPLVRLGGSGCFIERSEIERSVMLFSDTSTTRTV